MKRLLLVLAAATILVGCRGKPTTFKGITDSRGIAAGVLAEEIKQQMPDGGTFLFVYTDEPEKVINAVTQGLKKGLGDGFTLKPVPPETIDILSWMTPGGTLALTEILAAHGGAQGIISLFAFRENKQAPFPKDCPPLFALNWFHLPDAATMMQNDKIMAGVFTKPGAGRTLPETKGKSPQEIFDQSYLLVTKENLRETLQQY